MARTTSVLLAALLTGSLLAAPPPGPAAAVGPLALDGFADLVVDDAHGRVFVSQGTTEVVVTDLAGQQVASVLLPGPATDLVLAEDGSSVFALVAGTRTVASIDPVLLLPTLLDLGTGEWEPANHPPLSRHGHGFVALDGAVYAIGGCQEWPLRDVRTVDVMTLS